MSNQGPDAPKTNKTKSEQFKEGRAASLFGIRYFTDNPKGEVEVVSPSGLPFGPKVKSQFTYNFETIVEALLRGDPSHFTLENNQYFVEIGKNKFNLSEILAKADLQQLVLNKTHCTQYVKFLSNESRQTPQKPNYKGKANERFFRGNDKKGALKNLHFAEMAALNIYTQNYYEQMNAVLRGMIPFDSNKVDFQKSMKEVMLHIAMASTGLSKCPVKDIKICYRYDGKSLPQSIVQARIDSVNSSESDLKVTVEAGFTSTSKEKPGGGMSGPYRTVFGGLVGKDIAAISYFPEEREFLIPPTQIKWITYNKDEQDNTYFLATPVNTPIGPEEGVKPGQKLGRKAIIDPIVARHETYMMNQLLRFAIETVENYHMNKGPKKGLGIIHARRTKQSAKIRNEIIRLINNRTLTADEKIEHLNKILKKVHKSINLEKKIPFTSKESRLEEGIEGILTLGDNLNKIFNEYKRERSILDRFHTAIQEAKQPSKASVLQQLIHSNKDNNYLKQIIAGKFKVKEKTIDLSKLKVKFKEGNFYIEKNGKRKPLSQDEVKAIESLAKRARPSLIYGSLPAERGPMNYAKLPPEPFDPMTRPMPVPPTAQPNTRPDTITPAAHSQERKHHQKLPPPPPPPRSSKPSSKR